MPSADDVAIIHAVLHGDVDRYAELVDRYQGMALKVAVSLLGNAEDARDVSQDAFLSAFQSLSRFRQGAAFSTWLYRIIVNKCKDLFRRRAHRPRIDSSLNDPDAADDDGPRFLDVVEDGAADPRADAATRELSSRINTAIGALPVKQRTAFVLHHVHGLAVEETAAVMGCRAGTVKSHIFRATQRLRDQLEPSLRMSGSE